MMHVVLKKNYFSLSILVFCWAGLQINKPSLCHTCSTQVTYFILPIKTSPCIPSKFAMLLILVRYMDFKNNSTWCINIYIDTPTSVIWYILNLYLTYALWVCMSPIYKAPKGYILLGIKLYYTHVSIRNTIGCRNIILPGIEWGVCYDGFYN